MKPEANRFLIKTHFVPDIIFFLSKQIRAFGFRIQKLKFSGPIRKIILRSLQKKQISAYLFHCQVDYNLILIDQ